MGIDTCLVAYWGIQYAQHLVSTIEPNFRPISLDLDDPLFSYAGTYDTK
jgi:hypothetical protein